MSVAGIICEYNPFHEGHKFHIEKVRELTGADTVVAVMNGDFMQRGGPAVADKYIRTKMALSEGADIVFELPVRYGLSSAEDFAYGGMLALHSLSFVDYFCFGSEGADVAALKDAGQFFAEEPDGYKERLRSLLREGSSYPAAREQAYVEIAGVDASTCRTLFLPNNILGIEYIRAAARLHTQMKPIIIERKGRGYHDRGRDKECGEDFLSATAIRQCLKDGEMTGIPERAEQELKQSPCFLEAEDFWPSCSYAIRNRWEELEEIKDVSREIAGAFRRNWYEALSLKDFTERCKTKNVTMTRLRRCVFQTLLGLQKEPETETKCSYLRLLGMKRGAAERLGEVNGTIILGRLAKDMERLSDTDRGKLQQDIKASDLYRSIAMGKSGKIQPEEYKRPVIFL